MENKKYKVIIDTDPGVDDAVCLIYAFFDDNIDIKLLTSVVGNVNVETATRNLLHLVDLYDVNFPVAKGAKKALCRNSPTAEFIHQKEGLGGYIPPENAQHDILKEDAVDAIYKVIESGDGDIIPIVLGPHTNIATLIQRYPNVVKKIPKIVFMGGSPYGIEGYPNHISFNISSDPEAFKIVLDSKIPLIMLPSIIGRRHAHLDENYVNKLKEVNDTGKLMQKMYSLYWEPGYPDKRVATNDICALFALVYPEIFESVKCNVTVDLEEVPGKTWVDFTENGNVELITDLDRDAFLEILDTDLLRLNDIKLNI
jgi:non-specific riboncleoside hydrolase